MYRNSEIGGMTKKSHQKFWWMKIKNVLEKVILGKFVMESEIFSEIGGNLKQGENASLPQGEWTPLVPYSVQELQVKYHLSLV